MKVFGNTLTVQKAWDKFYPSNVHEKKKWFGMVQFKESGLKSWLEMCLLRCSLSFLYWWYLNTLFVMINKIFPYISRCTGNNPTVVKDRQIRCSSFYNFRGIWMVFLGYYCLCWYSQWTYLPYRPAAFGITQNHAWTSSNHPAFLRGQPCNLFLSFWSPSTSNLLTHLEVFLKTSSREWKGR